MVIHSRLKNGTPQFLRPQVILVNKTKVLKKTGHSASSAPQPQSILITSASSDDYRETRMRMKIYEYKKFPSLMKNSNLLHIYSYAKE